MAVLFTFNYLGLNPSRIPSFFLLGELLFLDLSKEHVLGDSLFPLCFFEVVESCTVH